MNAMSMTLEEIRRQGVEALVRELGPVGMVRFLQQYETGAGDYSTQRHQWLSDDLPTIMDHLKDVS